MTTLHVTSNLVHKLYRVQTIIPAIFLFFESQVFKDDLAASEVKQKSIKRTWYILTAHFLNGLLNQVGIFTYCSIKVLNL
jgi:hypothetical protein